jgi:hypothetical protein
LSPWEGPDVSRLVIDYVGRRWWIYAAVAPMSALLWTVAGGLEHAFSPGQVVGDSMCGAAFYALQAIAIWPSREYAVLPLSASDVWRARWVIATLVSPIVILLGAVIATVLTHVRPGGPSLTWSFALNAAFCGAFFACAPWAGRALHWIGGRSWPTPVLVGAVLLAVSAGVLVFVAPMLLADRIPARWDQLSIASAAVLIGMAGLAVRSFVSPERLWVTAGASTPPSQSRVRWTARATTPTWRAGVGGLIVRTWATISVSLLIWACLIPVVFEISGRQIISSVFSLGGDVPLGVLLIASFVTWDWVGSPSPRIQLRLLRTLPVTGARLNTALLVPGPLAWVTAWGAALLAHPLVIGGWPASLRGDLLVLLIGFSALGTAWLIRWRRGLIAYGALALLAGYLLRVHVQAPPAGMYVAGIAGAATAWWLNLDTVTRKSDRYRP